MSQELAQDENDADAEDYELGESRHHDPSARDFELGEGDDDEHGGLMRGGGRGSSKYSQHDHDRGYTRTGSSDRAERGELNDEHVVFALEGDDSDVEGDIGRTGRDEGAGGGGAAKKAAKKDHTD